MPITCEPSNIFNPIEQGQHLFLGCSIEGITASAGWSSQGAEVTVNLIQDTCEAPAESPKNYWDRNLQHKTTTAPDPGFIGEAANIVGLPVYLRLGNWEYSGIINNYERSNNASGNPRYSVKLTSPFGILEGSQLIINDYLGSLGNTIFSQASANVLNTYGYAESINGQCFSEVIVNENGMRWHTIQNSLNALINSYIKSPNQFSPYGRLIYRGINLSTLPGPMQDGFGLINADTSFPGFQSEYFLDLSELPMVPNEYRFDGTNISILDAISSVCQDAGHDFYIELLFLRNVSPATALSRVAKVIKIRTVSRVDIPVVGRISQFVENAKASGTFISGSLGHELRNELTSAMLIGGNQQYIHQAFQNYNELQLEGFCDAANAKILPHFGINPDGTYMLPCFNVDSIFGPMTAIQPSMDLVNDLNMSMEEMSFSSAPVITEFEMYLARAGFDMWQSAIAGDLSDTDSMTDTGKLIHQHQHRPFLSLGKLEELQGKAAPRDITNLSSMVYTDFSMATKNLIEEDIRRIHAWVSAFAEHSGRDFMVLMPSNCVRIDSESNTLVYAEEPTNEGGWSEEENTLGLLRNTFPLDFFSDDDGKIHTFVRLDETADYIDMAHANPDDFITLNNRVYVKAQVDPQIIFLTQDFAAPRVKITLPDVFMRKTLDQQEEFDAIHGISQLSRRIRKAKNQDLNEEEIKKQFADLYDRVGAKLMNEAYVKQPIWIDAAAIPIKSNVFTYGPWFTPGPPGQTRVEKDDGLVPWNYNGLAPLNMAAQNLVNEGVSRAQFGETGQVTLAGYPLLPLGAEINALGAGLLNGQHLVESRTPASAQVYNGNILYIPTNKSTGSQGPNVTGVTISFNDEITTTYQLRTFTPYFGRFAKYNAERLQRIGKNELRLGKAMRLQGAFAERSQMASSGTRYQQFKDREKQITRMFSSQTPHEVFVAEIYEVEEGRNRTLVVSESLNDLPSEINANFSHKAIMSLDGLIRPVSMDGYGDLPRYTNLTGTRVFNNSSKGSIGPLYSGTGDTLYYAGNTDSSEIDQDDLNPFSNPSGNRGKIAEYKHDGPIGHDIDILGRQGSGEHDSPDNLQMGVTGDKDYQDDYGVLALRGPLLLQAWGYDIDGKPIPNKADTVENTESGDFTTEDLQDKFLDGFLHNPKTWPVAPVDLRFDRDRGVWVSPQPRSMLLVELTEELLPESSGRATIISPEFTVYDSSGEEIEDQQILLYELVGNGLESGDRVISNYNETTERWEAIQASTSSIAILVTGDISAASWTKGTKKLEPTLATSPKWFGHEDDDNTVTYDEENTVTYKSYFTTAISVSEGHGKIGLVVGGRLANVDCNEIELPEED